MKLIIAKPSPYARKVRIALLEKRIPFETIIENPWLPSTDVPNINPLGKVPALVLDDGQVVHDSKVIIEHLESLDVAPRLIPQDARLRVAHKQIEALADGVCDAIVLIILERSRPEAKRSNDWMQRQHKKIVAGVAELSRLLGRSENFTPAGLGLAEVASACALDYLDFRFPEYDWRADAPNLEPLRARMSERPSFVQTKPEPQVLPTTA